MPNQDERRIKNARSLLMNSCKYEPETIDPKFNEKWNLFIEFISPHFGSPTEIADKYVKFANVRNAPA